MRGAESAAQRQRKFDCWLGVAVTRQIVFDRSSATIRAPRLLSTVTPTGRPRVLPSSPMKPVSTSTGGPMDGRCGRARTPPCNRWGLPVPAAVLADEDAIGEFASH